MASRVTKAIMNCDKEEHSKICNLGLRVKEGVYKNTSDYPNPEIDAQTFSSLVELAINHQANVKSVGVTTRNASTLALFAALSIILNYVNKLYKGVPKKLKLSGFDSSSVPSPHGIVKPPVINRIEKGKLHLSAKIYLLRKKEEERTKRERLNYFVQVAYVDEHEPQFNTVLIVTSSFKLLLTDCIRGKEILVRIAILNAAGLSDWSTPVPYIPQ